MSIEKRNIASEAKHETNAIRSMMAMVGTIKIGRKRPAKRPGGRVNKRPIIWGGPGKVAGTEIVHANPELSM